MKKLLFLSIIATILFACSSSKTGETKDNAAFNFDTTKIVAGTEYYQCPMHPEVLSDKSADCPKCGMLLEKITKK